MITYAGTFITGFSNVVEKNLKSKIKNCEILTLLDGLIIFKCSENILNLKIPFLNNIYYIIDFKKTDSNANYNFSLQNFTKKTNVNINELKKFIKKNSDFKILTIDKNQPTSVNFKLIEPLEKLIISRCGLRLNKRNPKTEFVILRRSENIILFMLKISNNRQTEKTLKKGELRPELANLMISLSNLSNTDIVIDPFCGSGAIPKEIIRHFPYNMCFASDIDDNLISILKKEYKENNKKLFIKKRDALDLSYFEDNFIDVIITDPPWNIYNKQDINFEKFYEKMLTSFKRILKDSGSIIILMGNIDEFEKALSLVPELILFNKIDTLVNGKKASIYVIKKHI